MASLYSRSPGDKIPFHISVGAVLVNDEGKVLVHKLSQDTMPSDRIHLLGGLQEAYILMRESLENGETLEQAVRRGLAEEFGAEAEVIRYLGSIRIQIPESEPWEKTTLYFEARLLKEGERPKDDMESHSTLEWVSPEVLVEKMRAQGVSATRNDLDESKILEAYIKLR